MGDHSEIWQDTKSGGLYTIVEEDALMQSGKGRILSQCVVYRSLFDGQVWVLEPQAFYDAFRNLHVEEVADVRTEEDKAE